MPCEPGHYCNRFGLSEMSGECEEGFYCEQGARSGTPPTGSGYGGPCTPGHMCTAGSTQETKCLRGTYQPNYYRTECLTCPAGYVCDEDGLYSLKSVLPDSTVGKALDHYHRVSVLKVKSSAKMALIQLLKVYQIRVNVFIVQLESIVMQILMVMLT